MLLMPKSFLPVFLLAFLGLFSAPSLADDEQSDRAKSESSREGVLLNDANQDAANWIAISQCFFVAAFVGTGIAGALSSVPHLAGSDNVARFWVGTGLVALVLLTAPILGSLFGASFAGMIVAHSFPEEKAARVLPVTLGGSLAGAAVAGSIAATAGFIFGFPLGAFFYLYGSAWGSRRVEAVQYIGEMSLMGLAGGVLLGGVGLVFVAPVGSVMATYANVERLRIGQE